MTTTTGCPPRRFRLSDRVCCNRGSRGWVVGTICMTDEPEKDHNGEPTGAVYPYIVELDGADGRMITVPRDTPDCVVTETCWPDEEEFYRSGPFPVATPVKPDLRFGVGDKVTCLVGNSDGLRCEWVRGEVVEVWAQRPGWRFARDGTAESAAYAIRLLDDSASCGGVRQTTRTVLAHRDDHRLCRDATLQEPGVACSGTATRFGKRRREDGKYETIDQQTRKIRLACGSDDSRDGNAAAAPSTSPDVIAHSSSSHEAEKKADVEADASTDALLMVCGECA